ncbi:MFS transporter [Sphaerisporangium siamense]|uniref:MFS family permease n=1 Tax=Sphaerisporangium siamense TaxID=795645 RepID=A0A7W7DB72_9ACTN|nr:MFS transporter [Sphaerisporangium siamense]MBB4703617.1 MFS family permease [Sphaerisporangium siamense]GII82090.1 MFS transporter [Sphaerisporangium siamense]
MSTPPGPAEPSGSRDTVRSATSPAVPPSSVPGAALRRARWAVYVTFAIPGMAIGVWTARIPAIKESLALSDGRLSVALLAIAAGALAGMQVIGRLADRRGAVGVMVPLAFAQAAVLLPPAFMPGLTSLAASLAVFGLVHGMLDIAMNAVAVEVERAGGRPLMSSFHAAFSVGGFAGAGIGALFAHAHAAAWVTFAATAALLAVLAAAAAWAILPAMPAVRARPAPPPPGAASAPPTGTALDTAPAITTSGTASAAAAGVAPVTASGTISGGGRAARRGGGVRGVLFLGVLVFCCGIGEGAAADWGSVYMREDLAASAGVAALAYAAFSIMMTAGRLAGDRLAHRFGPAPLVRACGLLAGAGLAAALLLRHPAAAIAGFACFGAGLSCIVPQVFSAAGNRDPARAGRALARVAGLGYLGLLTGPVLIGGAAEWLGLPRALAIPAALAVLVALAARAVRAPRDAQMSSAGSGGDGGRSVPVPPSPGEGVGDGFSVSFGDGTGGGVGRK